MLTEHNPVQVSQTLHNPQTIAAQRVPQILFLRQFGLYNVFQDRCIQPLCHRPEGPYASTFAMPVASPIRLANVETLSLVD
jgi:hypothetical protein